MQELEQHVKTYDKVKRGKTMEQGQKGRVLENKEVDGKTIPWL
jgi:hypothetical protein